MLGASCKEKTGICFWMFCKRCPGYATEFLFLSTRGRMPIIQSVTEINKIVCFMLVLFAAGCGNVVREWTICSEPSGALVEVSGKEVGRTPVTITFTYYGDYPVILRKEGYETLCTSVNLDPPWYQYPGIDFFTEVLPVSHQDLRQSMHELKKKKTPSEKELLERAKDLRERTGKGD